MTLAVPFEMIQMHAARLRHMSGGQISFPTVMVIDESGQGAGSAGQHSCYECDTWYAHLQGVKTVVPATAYDAKGLMHAAIRDPDPIVYIKPGSLGRLTEDVPNEDYEVPIGKAAVRTEGEDLTIVTSGPGLPWVLEANEQLQQEGISAEVIDLRTLHPMDTETLVNSVQKTGRLLTVDESPYTLCPGAEVIARVAEQVYGAHYTRIAFPDAPPPAGWEMFNWMKPVAKHVYDAALVLLSKGSGAGAGDTGKF
jgi:pyruvate dehydrogenase E1 component beta subunit